MIAATVFASALLLNSLAYLHARAMLRFSPEGLRTNAPEALGLLDKLEVMALGVQIPRPTDTATPRDHGLTYESREIPVTEGVTLGAWWIAHADPVGTVVLFHGYAASKSTLLHQATVLHRKRYSCLLVDFRGSGESSGADTTVGFLEAQDVRAAIQQVVGQKRSGPLLVYGQSMGGAAALRANSLSPLAIDGLILESVFDRMLTTVKQRFYAVGIPATPLAELLTFWGGFQSGFWSFAHNPVDYASDCHVPVLMLHGTDDPRVTLNQARSVYEALAGAKSMKVFPGAKHQSLVEFDEGEWAAALDEFTAPIANPTGH
ncbi:MAG: alpha/beta fold hydrolase [Polyangiaceae bacterium]|nr:alpha/beta fold hydrolase [Polyangiaceae bacterium]